jgi:hypothetical protein
MAFAEALSTAEPRSNSIGTMKMEFHTYTAANGDTAGTVTAKNMSTVLHAIVDGVVQTAVPSFSGQTVTLAFNDPGAGGAAGTIILFGR